MGVKFEDMSKDELAGALDEALDASKKEAEAAQQLVHELQVHQIELEMQNRELREAQEALEESRSRYADLFDLAPVGYLTLDRAGKMCEVNLTAARMLGLDRAVLVGRAFQSHVKTGDRDTLRRYLHECFFNKGLASGELTLVAPSRPETAVHVVTMPLPDSMGEVSTCKMTLTNITRLKESEAALRFLAEASEALSSSLDYVRAVGSLAKLAVPGFADICYVDLLEEDSSVRRLEPAVATSDRKKQDELAKAVSGTVVDPDGSSLQARVLRTAAPLIVSGTQLVTASEVALGASSVIVVPLVARGRTLGTLTFVQCSARAYSDRQLALAVDVARRAALAIDNARLYEAAQHAIRAREDLLAVVSHDLRNPLSSIVFAAAILLESAPQAERRKSRKQIEAIRRGAERMERMIGDLLDMSSIDAGHLSIDRDEHEVRDLLKDVGEALGPSAHDRGIRFDLEPFPESVRVECDRDRVLQIFTNLIENAVKFTPAGGSIAIQAEPSGSEVRFAVRDTGPGIAKEQRRRLFDRYWRANERSKAGRGLGLYIARGIVEAQGGRMWVESQVGVGSTFYFTLPVADGQRARELKGAGVALVVDDEEHCRTNLRALLEARGFEVVECTHGAEAIEYLRSNRPRPKFIFLDLDMPAMTGEAVLGAVKSDPALADIPVFLVSSRHDLATEAAALGARGYLGKPVRKERLLSVLSGELN
jgi:PAS domain S-box-containing protein